MLPLDQTPPYTANVVPPDDNYETETETETVTPRLSGDEFLIDSTCSTPYVSAPSSPGRTTNTTTTTTTTTNNGGGYFFSAPASPMHFLLSSSAASPSSSNGLDGTSSFEFENVGSSMSSADELFYNGLIRPMKLSSHLQRPQILGPLLDLEAEEDEDVDRERDAGDAVLAVRGRDLKQLRSRSLHRKARSLSPLRSPEFPWELGDVENENDKKECEEKDKVKDDNNSDHANVASPSTSVETTPSCGASSSRSSSERRNSRKWMFLKDLWLHRSKSEGRSNSKDKFWSSISFSPVNKSHHINAFNATSATVAAASASASAAQAPKQKTKKKDKVEKSKKKPENGVAVKRRGPSPSPHELHYTANRAQVEEMKKRTFLPYKQGLFGCLGFSSKGYGALNGLARSLNPVSSR